MRIRFYAFFFLVCLLLVPVIYGQEEVRKTSHNLSISGQGGIAGETEEICVFCHIPHSQEKTTALWSHKLPSVEYKVPTSRSQENSTPQPDGVSLQCLGCHDGTIGLGDLSTRVIAVAGKKVDPAGRLLEDSSGFLGTDLSGHHPISVLLDVNLIQEHNQMGKMPIRMPPNSGWLDGQSKVQCTTCHDPHSNRYPEVAPFFRKSDFDQLCMQCHVP